MRHGTTGTIVREAALAGIAPRWKRTHHRHWFARRDIPRSCALWSRMKKSTKEMACVLDIANHTARRPIAKNGTRSKPDTTRSSSDPNQAANAKQLARTHARTFRRNELFRLR